LRTGGVVVAWVLAAVVGACGEDGGDGADVVDARVDVDVDVDGSVAGDADASLDADASADVGPDTSADADAADEDADVGAEVDEVEDDVTVEVGEDVAIEDGEVGEDVASEDGEVGEDVASEVGEDADVAIEEPDEAPEVVFSLASPRTLYFLNNPEQLVSVDLGDGDLGDKTLLRVSASGPCRSFFEHVNETGRTIGMGVQVYNPGPGERTVTVRGVGFVASIEGGVPFAEALDGEGAAAPIMLAAGASTWILRRDEAVPDGRFFSGVVDYDVDGGAVIVNHTAYDRFAGLDGSTSELGYVQRIEPDGTHEARMYKGRASASEAVLTPLELRFDEATAQGALPVRVRRWDLTTSTFEEPVEATSWISHIGPGQNVAATTSDMVTIELASFGTFDARTQSDGEGKYPNLGNWGVVYRLSARVTNEGTTTRTVTLRITASPGAGAALAWAVGDGAWSAHRLAAGATLDLEAATIGPGASAALDASWVLGGPSGGAIRHTLVLGP